MVTRHDVARVISLSFCPGLILMTFLTMEVALGTNLEALNIDSCFTPGFRWFVHTTLTFPFFLGVLLGHWYHPVPGWFRLLNERLYREHQFIPIVIVLTLTVILLTIGCIVSYVLDYAVPSFVNTILVIVGIFTGALIWPVHVFEDIEVRLRREGAHEGRREGAREVMHVFEAMGAHEAIHELHSR
jgi:hypothetical protein